MGAELRWQTLESSATADSNAVASWTNTTDTDIYIRTVEFSQFQTDDAAANHARAAQLAKDDTFQTGDTRTQWTPTHYIAGGAITSGAIGCHGVKNLAYPRGGVVLRPNETLNLHLDITGGPDQGQTTVQIGYEFA